MSGNIIVELGPKDPQQKYGTTLIEITSALYLYVPNFCPGTNDCFFLTYYVLKCFKIYLVETSI